MNININTFIQAMFLLIMAGSFCGCWAVPTKKMRLYEFEHWLFILAIIGLIVLPWLTAILFCPNILDVLHKVPIDIILRANVCSVAWGIANILFGYCLERIGFSLTFGIMTGIGLPVGVITPLIIKGTGKFVDAPPLASPTGKLILLGVVIMLLSVSLTAFAGYMKHERESGYLYNEGLTTGILMAIMIGILQIGMFFAFVYSQGPITDALIGQGAKPSLATIGVWAVSLPGGALSNIIYAFIVITRKNTWHIFSKSLHEFILGLSASCGLFLGMTFMGVGISMLGVLGSSVGFGIVQAFQIMVSQTAGCVLGEWKHSTFSAKILMILSVLFMLIAVVCMAFANWLKDYAIY